MVYLISFLSYNVSKLHRKMTFIFLWLPSGNNQCSVNHGGCSPSALCLTTPAGRVCACADGQHQEKDNITCSCKLTLVFWGLKKGHLKAQLCLTCDVISTKAMLHNNNVANNVAKFVLCLIKKFKTHI